MRMELCKVTTWQGKSVIKNPKNTTNKFFYYLYFTPSSLQKMKKYGYTQNIVG